MKDKLKNFTLLGMLNLGNMVFPIAVIPLLISGLSVEGYGKFAFAQTICNYLSLIVGYGLTQVATVEYLKADKDELKIAICRTVVKVRGLIYIAVGVVLGIVAEVINLDSALISVVLILYVGLISEVITPLWLFQAKEKYKPIVLANFAGKFVNLILIILFYRTGNVLLIAVSYSVGSIIASVISTLYALKLQQIKWGSLRVKGVEKKFWIAGFHLCLSDLVGAGKDKIAAALIVNQLGYKDYTVFDVVYKIVIALTSIACNAITIQMPRFIKNGYIGLNKVILTMFFIGSLLYIICGMVTQYICDYLELASVKLEFVELFWVLGLWIPVVCMSATIGRLVYLGMGYNWYYLRNTITTTAVAALGLFFVGVLGYLTVESASAVLVMSVVVELFNRLRFSAKNLICRNT